MKNSPKLSQNTTQATPQAPKKRRNRAKAAEQPLPGTRAFYKLQMEWYDKLKQAEAGKEDGFKDLERQANTGSGNDLPMLFGQSLRGLGLREQRLGRATSHYYTRYSCYAAHHRFRNPRHRMILELFAKGIPIRKIPALMKEAGMGWSYTSVELYLRRIKEEIVAWNKTSPHGMDFESDF